MKETILLFTFFFSFSVVKAENPSEVYFPELGKCGTILYNSNDCTIVEFLDENDNSTFWIFSEIANILIPKAVDYLCVKLVGPNNEEICRAVADGVDLMLSLRGAGQSIRRRSKSLLKYQATRKVNKSQLSFWSNSIETASDVRNVLEAYKKLGNMNWGNISSSMQAKALYAGHIDIKNDTYNNLMIQLSYDGKTWKHYSLESGYLKEYHFWKGHSYQAYGFIKIEGCTFQIDTSKRYRILYNPFKTEYELKEKK